MDLKNQRMLWIMLHAQPTASQGSIECHKGCKLNLCVSAGWAGFICHHHAGSDCPTERDHRGAMSN